MKVIIEVAKDFSHYPKGREDGEYFKESFLIPLLEVYDTVIIDFSDVRTPACSFLDEAFSPLKKHADRIEIITDKILLSELIESYLGKEEQLCLKEQRKGNLITKFNNWLN